LEAILPPNLINAIIRRRTTRKRKPLEARTTLQSVNSFRGPTKHRLDSMNQRGRKRHAKITQLVLSVVVVRTHAVPRALGGQPLDHAPQTRRLERIQPVGNNVRNEHMLPASNYITRTLRANRPPEGTFATFTPQRANVTETSGVISASDVALDHAHASPLRNLRRRAERNAASKTGEPRCLTAPS